MSKIEENQVILTADTPNVNGIVYPRAELEKAVEAFAERIRTKGPVMGELNPANDSDSPRLDLVSHTITAIRMDGDKVVVDARFIENQAGKLAQELFEKKMLRFHPVGSGIVNSDHTVSGYSLMYVNIASVEKFQK